MIIQARKFVEAVRALHRWASLKSEQPRLFNGIKGDVEARPAPTVSSRHVPTSITE
jgi:hypothetical protein